MVHQIVFLISKYSDEDIQSKSVFIGVDLDLTRDDATIHSTEPMRAWTLMKRATTSTRNLARRAPASSPQDTLQTSTPWQTEATMSSLTSIRK